MRTQNAHKTKRLWLKGSGFTLLLVFGIFFLVLGVVVVSSFFRTSNRTGIDPARIQEMRQC